VNHFKHLIMHFSAEVW